jgi:prepilin-type N-terminal cleavage/methylation domain-containing protein
MNKKGFTAFEVLIVLIIVGILATFAVNNLAPMRERSWDDEARQNLVLIQRAESAYLMENQTYYPAAGSTNSIGLINTNLGLYLPTGAARIWNYEVWSTGCSRATRNGGDARSWSFAIGDADDRPDAGAGCP